MGLLKITQNQVVMAEGILQLTATISANTLTIDVVYALVMKDDYLAKANIVYTKGGSNSFVLTEAQYLAEFAEAFSLAMGTSGPALVGPIVEQKVTSTGMLVGTITPEVTLKLSTVLT
tara:strand:- start:135 stop:488 length:354 start_codon:yes stop_codon:yes gene_type:complete